LHDEAVSAAHRHAPTISGDERTEFANRLARLEQFQRRLVHQRVDRSPFVLNAP
jgi:hypothetical protein